MVSARQFCLYRSQNSPPEGNGVHFMFADVSKPVFSEESEGVDHFLKKDVQHAHFCPFGPLVGQIKKALLFDISNIFSIKKQQLLCFEIRLIN